MSEHYRNELFQKFGTFSRGMMTMAEITIANWVPVCRLLYEVSELYGLIIIVYVVILNFAVLRVITGVF